MKKEFYFGTHFNGSFELKSKSYPNLSRIEESEKLIIELRKKGYKINLRECYANFDETSEVPFNQAKIISKDEKLKEVVLKGINLEILVKNEHHGSNLLGGSFSQGIGGYISLKNAKTKKELNKIEEIIENNWHVENKEGIIPEPSQFKKCRKLSDINLRRGYQF